MIDANRVGAEIEPPPAPTPLTEQALTLMGFVKKTAKAFGFQQVQYVRRPLLITSEVHGHTAWISTEKKPDFSARGVGFYLIGPVSTKAELEKIIAALRMIPPEPANVNRDNDV